MKGHGVVSHSLRSSLALSRILRGDAPNEPKIVSRYDGVYRGDILVYHDSSFGNLAQKRNVQAFHVQNLLAHFGSRRACH